MPLSENEQRLLEQMERALYAEDPKFATALRGSDPRRRTRRRVAIASVVFGLGVVLLMTGLVTNHVLTVSVVGFVTMLVSAIFAISSYRQVGNADLKVVGGSASPRTRRRRSTTGKNRPAKAKGGFMARMEQRWTRRRDERDR